MQNTSDSSNTMPISVTMLGGLSLHIGSEVLSDDINRSHKLWSVLCYLIVNRNREVSQSEFIDLFWMDENRANPVNALKTLLYRVRSMLEPYFGSAINPILSRRGTYAWNPAIVCDVDIDHFEVLCRKSQDATLENQLRMELYQEAIDLYRGDFLPKLSNHMWVISKNTYYHGLYIDTIKSYAALLEEAKRYDEMYDLCNHAQRFETLDEGLHIMMIRALLHQGKDAAALSHYEIATELLYRNLGVRPSEELRDLYTDIMKMERNLEMDLEVIQADLHGVASRPGAFVCEYGFFKEAYRLEARRVVRNGMSVHIALITVTLPNAEAAPLNVLNVTMEQLMEILVGSLRRGDVIARYSAAQYVIMLPAANFENSTMVMDRIVDTFYKQHRRNFLKLSYKIRELDLD
ncbi:MAG: hypothetical protein LUG13_05620 [Oscillospiraceae bacterium]|nr:hypothetical protein [Oscillospiraceae bacterium]